MTNEERFAEEILKSSSYLVNLKLFDYDIAQAQKHYDEMKQKGYDVYMYMPE